MNTPIKAWYFAPVGNRLASTRIIDALSYAETSILYRVELDGKVDQGTDKLAAQSILKEKSSNTL